MTKHVLDPSVLRGAVAALEGGGVIALPTETVYGLACDAANHDAVSRLFALKGRPDNVPLPVALPDATRVDDWRAQADARLDMLATRWWPGPLTVVVPANEGVSARITAGLATVALRVPDEPRCAAVLASFGRAIVLTSANRHGEPPARSAEAVASAFPSGLPVIVDGGPSPIGRPSTLVELLPGGAWRVLREGVVTSADLAFVLDA